jgi:hypothetical protein
MRVETRTVRVGEKVGEVDWDYDFRSHFDSMGSPNDRKDARCEQAKRWLRQIEDRLRAGEDVYATNDGGWPRCFRRKVCGVGMYDGWPYWRPVPSIYLVGPYGGEWWAFSEITDIYLGERSEAVRV